ncbi:MAG: hypothetical protein KJ558_02005 [Gammaproteobacteria bacterium]|nr:hypothetical protein [Gammaproteobacteria bacterium]MBU1653603.1 hypothetical protein [Gammaproteobacteria bacterium]MBU1960968.1 hypothetical protein [Gammaproteobacteria bacterium]
MKILARFKGLSSKIYFAFLVAAGVPVAVAGLVGIYSSLETLKERRGHEEGMGSGLEIKALRF